MISSGRFVASFPPFFMIDKNKSAGRMPPGLPTSDCVPDRANSDGGNNQKKQRAANDDEQSPALALTVPQFLRRKHEISSAHRFLNPCLFSLTCGLNQLWNKPGKFLLDHGLVILRLHHDELENLLAAVADPISDNAPAIRPVPV